VRVALELTSWGDLFFYYAPDGVVPTAGQPFATIVTKHYPDDAGSRLARPGAFRLNVAAGREAVRELLLAAHHSARSRYRRRAGSVGGAAPVEDGGEGREDHQEGE
jgi:hypothetical protein